MTPRLVVVVGPTAAGKSRLALRICALVGGEVVSADSMQVYRHFDIGTGKLALAEREGVPHHLIDVVDPSVDASERYSAARFVADADRAIVEIHARGRMPVVVGGTGLYVRALLHGLFAAPESDRALREEHERLRAEKGVRWLYEELERVDREAAAHIDPNDFVRISRALEVCAQTGQPVSALRRAHAFAPWRYPATIVGVRLEGEALRARIEARVDEMMAAGWLDEVRVLHRMGYGEAHPMGALGYRQLSAHLRGELDLAEAVGQTKRATWRFSRRQRSWFSSEAGVRWLADVEARSAPELERLLLEPEENGRGTGHPGA